MRNKQRNTYNNHLCLTCSTMLMKNYHCAQNFLCWMIWILCNLANKMGFITFLLLVLRRIMFFNTHVQSTLYPFELFSFVLKMWTFNIFRMSENDFYTSTIDINCSCFSSFLIFYCVVILFSIFFLNKNAV